MNESSYVNNISFGLKSQTHGVNQPVNNINSSNINKNCLLTTSTPLPASSPTNVNATALASTSTSAGLPYVLPFAYGDASTTHFFSSSTTNPSTIDKQANPNSNKNQMAHSQCNKSANKV